MENNLMSKIAEMLGVKIGEYVTIEKVDDPSIFWKVKLTDKGLMFDEDLYKSRMERILSVADYISPSALLNEEDAILKYWLCGEFRVKGSFPKDGDKVFSVVTKGIYDNRGYPRIEEIEFDSNFQFHLLLKDKGLLHETLEEAVKCFEKDYNMFEEMQKESKN